MCSTEIVKVRHSNTCSYNVVMGLCTYCKEPTEGVTKYSIELCVHDLRDEREQMWLAGYNDIGATLFKNASPEFSRRNAILGGNEHSILLGHCRRPRLPFSSMRKRLPNLLIVFFLQTTLP